MSRALSRYLMRRLLLYCALVLLLIVALLQVLDLMAHAQKIMDAPGANGFSLVRYALLRAPDLAVRFAPFAVLIAALLALTQWATGSEIIAMRACGMSPVQILCPLLAGAALIGLAHFGFQESLAAAAARSLQAWEAAGFAASGKVADQQKRNIWVSGPGLIAHADAAARYGSKTYVSGLTLYQIDQDGLLSGYVSAKGAYPGTPSWTLLNAERARAGQNDWRHDERIGWTTPLKAADFLPAAPPQSLLGLLRQVRKQRALDQSAARAMTMLLGHVAKPLSDVLMVVLALFAGFALPRQGGTAQHLLLGLGVGFLYFALDNLLLALGHGGVLSPFVAAFGALTVFTLASLYLFTGLEDAARPARVPASSKFNTRTLRSSR